MWPLRTDIPLRSTPWMNWILIALNILVFGAQHVWPGLRVQYILNPLHPQIAQFFTYAFLHADGMHIFGNLLFLYIFGNNVNDRMGHIGYLALYLAGGVFAGIGHVLTQNSPVLGASGAVSAVVGAFLVFFPRSHVTIIYFFIFIGTAEIASLIFVVFFFIKDLLPVLASSQEGVAHMAHLAGTVFGFVVCLAVLWLDLLPRQQVDILSLISRWNRRRQYTDMVSRGYDPFGSNGPTFPGFSAAPAAPNPVAQQASELRAAIGQAIAEHNLPQAAGLYLQLRQLDPSQVLTRQAQLDVANQLASQQDYSNAAEAYERFLQNYPKFEQIEQVELMLGLIYSRYLHQYPAARKYLLQAMAKLHDERSRELAKGELDFLGPETAERNT